MNCEDVPGYIQFTRRDYDLHLFQKRDSKSVHYIISKKRIKYSASLSEMLKARMQCPVCYGEDIHYYVCRGIDRINTTSQLEVTIPPHENNTTYIDVDLEKLRPDQTTNFAVKSIRIIIVV